jgi:RNA polymerase sigma-70 factor (ECF subfamily)
MPPDALTKPQAFRSFYKEALPVVYGYLLPRCGGNVAIAEDLTQDTFMAAVRWIRDGGAVETPLPWIVGIAKRKLIDHFRALRASEHKLALAWSAEGVEDSSSWVDAPRERVLAALAAVPVAQRSALALRYLDGSSVEEVAASLGRSLHATESLLARGRENFKRAYTGGAR